MSLKAQAVVAAMIALIASAPADARLSRKEKAEVAQIVKKELRSFRPIMGPPGPPGPRGEKGDPGSQGLPGDAEDSERYAYVFQSGDVDPARSKGIGQENVFLEPNPADVGLSEFPDNRLDESEVYCFTGLGKVNGAQVTLDLGPLPTSDDPEPVDIFAHEMFDFNQGVPGCEYFAIISSQSFERDFTTSGFFIWLY